MGGRKRAIRPRPLRLESLEDRSLLATLWVDNTPLGNHFAASSRRISSAAGLGGGQGVDEAYKGPGDSGDWEVLIP